MRREAGIHSIQLPPPAGVTSSQTVGMSHQRKTRSRRRASTYREHSVSEPLVSHSPDLPAYTRKAVELSEVPLVFGLDDAEVAGFTRARALAGDNLLSPLYGVRMSTRLKEKVEHPGWAEPQWFAARSRLAAVQARRPDAVGSHTTAAEVLGIPLPARFRGERMPVHVLSSVTSGVQAGGVVGHRGALTEPPVRVGGVNVTGYRQTLSQLAALLTERDLIVAVEGMIGPWRGSPASIEQLSQHQKNYPGRRGARTFRGALQRARPGVGSPKETELRLDLVEWGFPEPSVGVEVWIGDLQRSLTPDLLYEDIRTVIEYEGAHHGTHQWQMDRDIERAAAFRSAGCFVERVTKTSVLAGLISVLTERFAARRAGTLRFPSPY